MSIFVDGQNINHSTCFSSKNSRRNGFVWTRLTEMFKIIGWIKRKMTKKLQILTQSRLLSHTRLADIGTSYIRPTVESVGLSGRRWRDVHQTSFQLANALHTLLFVEPVSTKYMRLKRFNFQPNRAG